MINDSMSLFLHACLLGVCSCFLDTHWIYIDSNCMCTVFFCGCNYDPSIATGLTGDFCTSREERLEDRKEPENAKEDVYARADRFQAAAD